MSVRRATQPTQSLRLHPGEPGDTATTLSPEQLALLGVIQASLRLRIAVSTLLEGAQYAEDLGAAVEEFAVEWNVLRDSAISPNEVRWLHHKRLIRHLVEVFPAENDRRRFEIPTDMTFRDHSCFTLTEQGIAVAQVAVAEQVGPETHQDSLMGPSGFVMLPFWDPLRRELRWGTTLVKRVKGTSTNQELILTAFQEHGWPTEIGNPLPTAADVNLRRRLFNSISALNRHREHACVRFASNEDGTMIRWETEAA